jgi:hypothetical protein
MESRGGFWKNYSGILIACSSPITNSGIILEKVILFWKLIHVKRSMKDLGGLFYTLFIYFPILEKNTTALS